MTAICGISGNHFISSAGEGGASSLARALTGAEENVCHFLREFFENAALYFHLGSEEKSCSSFPDRILVMKGDAESLKAFAPSSEEEKAKFSEWAAGMQNLFMIHVPEKDKDGMVKKFDQGVAGVFEGVSFLRNQNKVDQLREKTGNISSSQLIGELTELRNELMQEVTAALKESIANDPGLFLNRPLRDLTADPLSSGRESSLRSAFLQRNEETCEEKFMK